MHRSVALSGKSGAGKTTIAEYLVNRYGYEIASSGLICREVCGRLFDSQAKQIMNQVTDALKAIDKEVWLRSALSRATGGPTVFDSMRFIEDHEYLTHRGFVTIRVNASLGTCIRRLHARSQLFVAGDELHRAEIELDEVRHDYTIENDTDDLRSLYRRIDRIVDEVSDPLR